MPKLTGGQALIQSIYREGVRVVFGVPGVHQYHAVDALYQEPGIRYISTRHEQATTYMADAYARVTGMIAAALVVPGPGLYNACAGIATAHAVSSPMLVITGDHAQPGQLSAEAAAVQPITKWTGRAEQVSDIPAMVREAFHHLKTGRPRPVEIEVSPKTLAAMAEVELLEPEEPAPIVPDPATIQDMAERLTMAQKPVIWAGAGIVRAGASAELRALAEYLQIPVVTSRQGKGVISSRHPLCLDMAELRYQPLRDWLDQRDLILAVGTSRDFSGFHQPVIKIDIDADELGSGGHIEGVLGDARLSLKALYEAMSALSVAQSVEDTAIHAEIAALNAARFEPAAQLQPQWDLMQAIRAAMPDDGILVQGMNQMGYYSRNYFPVYHPGAYLTASNHSTLGCAFPLALGAKVAMPNRTVVALSGDGGFLYNSQELATAVQYGINAVVIVFNDNAYGNVLRAQIEQFDEHVMGTQLHNPDFAKLAEVYGARGVRAEGADQLEAALREAMAVAAPTLIEVPVGMMDREY